MAVLVVRLQLANNFFALKTESITYRWIQLSNKNAIISENPRQFIGNGLKMKKIHFKGVYRINVPKEFIVRPLKYLDPASSLYPPPVSPVILLKTPDIPLDK